MNIKNLIEKLYPLHLNLMGSSNTQALKYIADILPVNILQYPSGQECFDWTIPKEWELREAFISRVNGERIIDYKDNILYAMNYGMPFCGRVSVDELKKHLVTIKDLPEAIPYATKYFDNDWGFCVSQNQYQALTDPEYDVVIDAEFRDGFLSIGEVFHPGRSKKEIWLSTYLCHPTMCNDNLSGIAVSVAIMDDLLKKKDNYYSYRLIICPETIGPLVYLSNNKEIVENIFGGYVVTCVGDRNTFTYKRSVYGNHIIDKTMERVLQSLCKPYNIQDFTPFGSDERQYGSALLKLAFGSLMRSSLVGKLHSSPLVAGFKEYHTSLDNLEFVHEDCLQDSKQVYLQCLENLEFNRCYLARYFGEVCLSKHDLYVDPDHDLESYLASFYFQCFADGEKSLWDLKEMSGLSIQTIEKVAKRFEAAELVAEVI